MKKHLDTILVLFAWVALFFILFRNKKAVREVYHNTSGYDYSIAYQINLFSNKYLYVYFNREMITKESQHHFGGDDEPLSSVFGKNQRDNTLTKKGDNLRKWIDKLDFGIKNHCLTWIREDINFQHKDFKLIKR